MLKWIPPSVQHQVNTQSKEPMGIEHRPHADSPYMMLMHMNTENPDRTNYYFMTDKVKDIRKNKETFDQAEYTTAAEYRAAHNMEQPITKNASAGSYIAQLLGAGLAGDYLGGKAAEALVNARIRNPIKRRVAHLLYRDQIREVKRVGQQAGSIIAPALLSTQYFTPKKDKKASNSIIENPEGHIFVTDVGMSLVPEHTSPKNVEFAYHLENPLGKYQPVMGTLAGLGGSLLFDTVAKKRLNMYRALGLSTLGGAIGTVKLLRDQEAYSKPYRKPFLAKLEARYGNKKANEGNEYITETGFKTMPFTNTAPSDLEVGYHFKNPYAKYDALLGGTGAGLAYLATMGRQSKLAPASFALLTGATAGTLLGQIHKDRFMDKYKKRYVEEVKREYGLKK